MRRPLRVPRKNLLNPAPTPSAESCTYAKCAEVATVALRFGDGTTRMGDRQTAVGYCAEHTELVKRLFVTCDERPIGSREPAVEDGVERAAQPWS